ncbi:MAG TPA: S8 family serine peptidase, partial [Holophagaceae bacterium]
MSLSACCRRFLLLTVAALPGLARSGRPAPPPPPQILVKVREPLARTLESEWSGPGRPLLVRGTQSLQTRAFLANHGAGNLRPLYPELIELRRKTGWSDAQIAEQVRRSFPARTRRLTRSHAVPEVSRVYLLEADGGATPQSLLAGLRADPNVEYAEVNHVASASGLPNDPFLGSSGTWGQPYQDLWGLQAIHAPAAWDTNSGNGMVVAVIDTGVDYNHPDIAVNMWTNPGEIAGNGIDDDGNGYVDDVRGMDFVGPDATHPKVGADPMDRHGHGTHAAGIIAATGNNGLGVVGVAWGAKIMALKGLDDHGSGLDTTLAPAIIYAAKNGADVINASWGGPGQSQT